MAHTSFLKKSFAIVLFVTLSIACKNKEEVVVENPVTSEAVSNALSDFSGELSQEQLLIDFYKLRNDAPAWNKKEVRESLVEQLEKAGEEGLSFNDYHGEKIGKLLQNKDNATLNDRISLEILLTDAFLNYADNLYYGKLDPKKMYEIWGIKRKEIALDSLLQKAVEKNEIEKTLNSLKPTSEIYTGLKESLREYRKHKEKKDPQQQISTGDPIKPGKKNERVPAVAARLKQLGLLDKNHVIQSNIYDKELQAAVKEFQKQKSLMTDEVLGNSTIYELNMGPEQRYGQLLVNLERWRWYPRDLGEHYILINIPNYQLSVVKDGKVVRTHNVIAGDKTHHTPVFSDSVQYIVVNPEWNIPSSIRDAEIIPSASANSNYLASRNIYVTGPDGKRVDPSSIDWSSGEAHNYRFTQGAGPSNSLGKIKIIYPNKYAIYLHDTPAKAIFEQNSRAESHGCVRVEHVIELAAYLLGDQEKWSLDQLNELISEGTTKRIPVTQPIQVHHFYWTAWRNNGETVFINDIYKLDKAVYTALEN